MSSTIRKTRNLIDTGSFWMAIGHRPSGATIVTANSVKGPSGLLALSTTHVTADPPTMLVSIDNTTSALETVKESNHFAINILPIGTEDLANTFSGKGKLKGSDRFNPKLWTIMTTGAPTYNNAVIVMDCELEDVIQRNNTSIVIGRVVDLLINQDNAPLIFYKGKFTSLYN
jgi:flavin reductase (DIM6/NTAB) family NADH-FMN oxidoreductase RutF|tara:strand:+ start:3549 stop:4064 length:516 start_codon:yes stop_codon:yes gene_type:complete